MSVDKVCSGRYLECISSKIATYSGNKIRKVVTTFSSVVAWNRIGIEAVRLSAKHFPQMKGALPIINVLSPVSLITKLSIDTYNCYQTAIGDNPPKKAGRRLPRNDIQKTLAIVSTIAAGTRVGIEVVRFSAKYFPMMKGALPIAKGLLPVVYITKVSILTYNSYQTLISDSPAVTNKVKKKTIVEFIIQGSWLVLKLFHVPTYGHTGLTIKKFLIESISHAKGVSTATWARVAIEVVRFSVTSRRLIFK
jgi:hypothetical protein